jgi:hypothetical protein
MFAAMLDQLAQGLTNGKAVIPADAASTTDSDSDTPDDTTAPAQGDANTGTGALADPMLAQLMAAQQAATNTPVTDSAKPNTAAPASDTGKDAGKPDAETVAAADAVSAPATTPGSGRNAIGPNRQLLTPSSDTPATPPDAAPDAGRPDSYTKGVRHSLSDDTQSSDPSQVGPSQAGGTDNAAPATPSTTPDPTVNAAVQSAAPAPTGVETAAALATNQAASSVVAPGTITKPGKATSGVTSSDSSKSEDRNTKASALADAGDVAKRGFASEPAIRAAALAVQGKADDADKPTANGAPPTQSPQHNAANPATLATPAQPVADAAQVQQAAAPTHTPEPAAQPDPGVSIATVNTGASPTQTAAAATPAHIAAQIQVTQHTPDLNALAVSIAAKSQDGQRHFDIRLDPAELGRVDVRLTVDDAGKAQATLSVEKPQTLELLQKDSSHLERALKDAGLELTQNGLNFSLKGQQQQQQAQDHTPFARGQRLAARAMAAIAEPAPILSSNGVSASDTRLDICV